MSHRVLITGSRDWDDWGTIYRVLNTYVRDHNIDPFTIVLVHGDAKGADTIAKEWAEDQGIATEAHPYPKRKGRKGGPIRNQEMVDLGADICFAFIAHYSKGSTDCMTKAEKAGIPIRLTRA